MTDHPLVLGLFASPAAAAAGARALRDLGVACERVSIVARSHDEEGALAEAANASPGSEIEDSRAASRLGELSGHLLAAIAIVLPGVGPIVADGPLAAGLGEAAGHLAGDIGRTLEGTGMSRELAEQWETRIHAGAVLVAGHVAPDRTSAARDALQQAGAEQLGEGTWHDS